MTEQEPTKYNKKTIETLKNKIAKNNLSRAQSVKLIGLVFKIKDRQARTVYKKYFENKDTVPATKVAPKKLKRLFWDIETSPNIVLSWRVGYKINIDYDNILKERAIICIAYKWEDEDEIHCLTWDDKQNDKAMLTRFLEVANEADELVAHNGDGFDMPWFKTRCLYHGLPPIPSYKTIDTLQWARRKFYFNSNRMDYIAKFLGLDGKIETTFGLWKEIVLNKCSDSMTKMVEYCKKDVGLLEKVYKKLASFAGLYKTHAGVLSGNASWTCPYTGSTNVKISKTSVTSSGTVKYQMKNLDSGSYYTVNAAAAAAYREAKKLPVKGS